MATSNRIGHPVRNRRKNRLIFNDNEETSFGPNRLNPCVTILSNKLNNKVNNSNNNNNSKSVEESTIPKGKINKNIGAVVANNLKNILKSSKYNRWIANEWFYSSIDQVLFLDENEFSYCLRESFPQLKTRHLTRVQWAQIRRLMGKPRRCSAAFFEEERATLNAKRNKIRYLQQNKVADLENYKDLPSNIPQQLVVGTKVTALIDSNKYLYTGTIEGINPANNTYRVNFDKPELGCLTIPDYEIASCDPPILTPLSSFKIKNRKIWHLQNRYSNNDNSSDTGNNQAIVLSQPFFRDPINEKYLGNYPIRFLSYLVRVTKVLTAKRTTIAKLKKMNDDIERMMTLSIEITHTFKREYALTIMELEKLNKEIHFYFEKIQQYSMQLAAEGKMKLVRPDILMQKCQNEAQQMVEKASANFKISEKSRSLIIYLMSLLIHLRHFRDRDINANELESLNKALLLIKNNISEANYEIFQSIEIQFRHIMSTVSHLGNVGAFSESIHGDNNKTEN